MAATAASSARDAPRPVPMPMSAAPASCMTARTSAKSTLIRPGLTMISDTPTMPCRRTSSATRKASASGASAGTIPRSLSFDTTIKVSTWRSSSSSAATAWRARFRPSKPKGFVTTPTVSAPARRAASATTGAAPLPVPPPMPAVTKTRSAPRTISSMSARLSTAAARPTAGSPPAPSPRVSTRPMCRPAHRSALPARACASVLTHQKSTPRTPAPTIRLTALQPPPPTPTTRMAQGRSSTAPPPAAALMTGEVRVRAEAELLASGKIRHQDDENVPAGFARRARSCGARSARAAAARSRRFSHILRGRIAGSKATHFVQETKSCDIEAPPVLTGILLLDVVKPIV